MNGEKEEERGKGGKGNGSEKFLKKVKFFFVSMKIDTFLFRFDSRYKRDIEFILKNSILFFYVIRFL